MTMKNSVIVVSVANLGSHKPFVKTMHPFVKTNPRILIKVARRNIEQKNPCSSNHLQKDTSDFGENIIKNILNL